MDRNVGASFTLSILTVLTFAVVLYQPEQPVPGKMAVAPGSPPGKAEPVEVVEARDPDATAPSGPTPVPRPRAMPPAPTTPTATATATPSRPRATLPLSRVRESRPMSPVARREEVVSSRPVPDPPRAVTVETPAPTASPGAAPRTPEPRGAFTLARAGETLRAVAERVYGSEDAAETLWKANRDLIERTDGPLVEGTLLRTP